MKKYIFTESQVKSIIDNTINEVVINEKQDKPRERADTKLNTKT